MKVKTKLVFGVGINDADYPTSVRKFVDGKNTLVWACPFYVRWSGMLRRCYYEKSLKKDPTYQDCFVVKHWLTFSNFKAWMETEDWQGKELDKDLLVPSNKIYSPETCIFIDSSVNKFLTERNKLRGNFPIGVSFHKASGKFQAECRSVTEGKTAYIGLFTNIDDAHNAWLLCKLEQAKILAAQQTDIRVAEALVARYESYKNEPENKE